MLNNIAKIIIDATNSELAEYRIPNIRQRCRPKRRIFGRRMLGGGALAGIRQVTTCFSRCVRAAGDDGARAGRGASKHCLYLFQLRVNRVTERFVSL